MSAPATVIAQGELTPGPPVQSTRANQLTSTVLTDTSGDDAARSDPDPLAAVR